MNDKNIASKGGKLQFLLMNICSFEMQNAVRVWLGTKATWKLVPKSGAIVVLTSSIVAQNIKHDI